MSAESLILKEKHQLLCNVFGKENINSLDAERKYLNSLIDETEDINSLFEHLILNIRNYEKLGNDAKESIAVLDKLILVILRLFSGDSRCFNWFETSSKFGLDNAKAGLGQCYGLGIGVQSDIDKAFEILTPLAESGNAIAQNKLGEFLELFSKDYEEAVKWYRKSSSQGFAEAQYNLGKCFYEGKGVERDSDQALTLYRKASEQGIAEAQNCLGEYYYDEAYWRGGEDDYTHAVKWFRKAAEQGVVNAQSRLGECYCDGTGVDQDDKEGVRWFFLAAEKGFAKAQYFIGVHYASGKGLGKSEEKAVEWYRKAAEQGFAPAQNDLGNCYYYGTGVCRDYHTAFEWYSKAANQDYTEAQDNVGLCYYSGHGVIKDYSKAVQWYQKAAYNDYPSALNHLGICYSCGAGVEKDIKKAFFWFQEAADLGDNWGLYNLGERYFNGFGVKKDETKGLELIHLSEKEGNPSAQEWLGDYYYDKKNRTPYRSEKISHLKNAFHYYKKAALQGISNAQYKLGKMIFDCGTEKDDDYSDRVFSMDFISLKDDISVTEKDVSEYKKLYPNESENSQKLGAWALNWLKKAADSNHIQALKEIAEERLPRDEAFEYYMRLANQGDSDAQKEIGFYYLKGSKDVNQSIEETVKWWRKSADNGNDGALLELCKLQTLGLNYNVYIGSWAFKMYRSSEVTQFYDEKQGIQGLIQIIKKDLEKQKQHISLSYPYYGAQASEWLRQIKKTQGIAWCLENGAYKWPLIKKDNHHYCFYE